MDRREDRRRLERHLRLIRELCRGETLTQDEAWQVVDLTRDDCCRCRETNAAHQAQAAPPAQPRHAP